MCALFAEAVVLVMGSPLDVLYPFAGPCWVCGGPDKRHRLADAIVGNVRGGDSEAMVANLYDLPETTVHALVEASDRYRRQHKREWS